MAAAGAHVSVVQRFHTAGRVERDGIVYELVKDSQVPWLSTKAAPAEFVNAIAAHAADLVHVNGLIFPQLVAAIRKAVGPRTAIVVQHHGGEFPIRGGGLVGLWRRNRWRGGLTAADAVSFTAREQAGPWFAAGVLDNQRILEIVESGTTLRHVDRARARTAVSAAGDPLILWVGRLTTNKDPLTVLDGLERALAPHHAGERVAGAPPAALPSTLTTARLMMVFGDDTLIEAVDGRVRGSPVLSERVTLAGRIARDELPNYYAAADVYVSGSHSEGSGYALIEAMSAGVIPVVTDIAPFRAIAGSCGERWTAGDATAFAAALTRVCTADLTGQRTRVIEHYNAVLRWEAIAERTISEYRALVDAKRGAAA
jgi:glycosyltransferase involved in cell wall biosynthesis